VEDAALQGDAGLGSRGDAARLGAGTEKYFTINWTQLVTTWSAFALFLIALASL
jgi:hypothetical protein